MKLLNILAYNRPAARAQFLAEKAASENELYQEVSRLTASQICDMADRVAAENIDRTMTPALLRALLIQGEKALI